MRTVVSGSLNSTAHQQLSLIERTDRWPTITTTEDIEVLLAAGAPVAIGVSGGKDSVAAAFATLRYLEEFQGIALSVLSFDDDDEERTF